MYKCDIRPEFECQNSISGPSSNVKIVFHVLKCDIRPRFECQNRNFECQIRYSASSNVKMDNRPEIECQIGFRMSKWDILPEFDCQNKISNVKFDIRPQFECQNRSSNVKMRYSARGRMSKQDFE